MTAGIDDAGDRNKKDNFDDEIRDCLKIQNNSI